MSKIATEVSVITAFAVPFLLFIFAAVIGFTLTAQVDMSSGIIFGGIFALAGLTSLAIVLWKLSTIIRAGKFVEFSAQLILDNKSLYIFPVLMSVSVAITFIMAAFSGIWIWIKYNIALEAIVEESQQQVITILAGLGFVITEFFYLMLFFIIYYILTGMVMSYAARWYRGEDPGPRTAIHDIKQVMPVIITYAAFTTTVHMVLKNLQRQAREAKFPLNIILGGILWIIGSFYAFFTYFTLPAIVIQKQGFKDSAVNSGKLVWNSAIDVMIGDTGFNMVMFVFSLMNRIIWGILGFVLGAGLSEAAGGVLVENMIVGLITGLIFFILFAQFSMSLINMPMKAAFTTFLYCYAIDVSEGFRQPSKLPVELRNDFSALAERAIAENRRKMREPSG
ncbi:MAG: hypothetical protein ACTSP4_16930 [Candidatus Hodarchaeales archaeon]